MRGKSERIERKFNSEKYDTNIHLVCQIQIFVVFEIFYVLLRIYELYEQSRESFDANIDEESNHFQEIPEEIYEDSDEIKGQLISEWLLDILNFPKNQRKNLMKFCPRI